MGFARREEVARWQWTWMDIITYLLAATLMVPLIARFVAEARRLLDP
jgi:hypothetical protein